MGRGVLTMHPPFLSQALYLGPVGYTVSQAPSKVVYKALGVSGAFFAWNCSTEAIIFLAGNCPRGQRLSLIVDGGDGRGEAVAFLRSPGSIFPGLRW